MSLHLDLYHYVSAIIFFVARRECIAKAFRLIIVVSMSNEIVLVHKHDGQRLVVLHQARHARTAAKVRTIVLWQNDG